MTKRPRPLRARWLALGLTAATAAWVGGGGALAPVVGADAAELEAARAEAQAAADAFVAADNLLQDTQARVAQTEVSVQAAREQYEALRRVVADELVDQYIRAGVGETPLVGEDLNAQARANALSRAVRGRTTSRADELGATKVALQRQLDDLARQVADAERQREELLGRQDDLYARLRELEVLEAQRQEEERLAEQARREAEAAAAQADYEAAVAAEAAAAAGSGGGGSGDGGAAARAATPPRPVVPVDWLCLDHRRVSYSDTKAARSNGRSHRGTDMFADYGTPLVAVVSGTAVNYGWEDAGGNGVFLLGDDGNRYFYAHLDEFGQLGRVSQGDVVGYVGDTGNATGTPHLHFEIHPGGSGWTNPYPTLIQYC
ncbi:MAG: peptidoglycan DD-metalloendopeptidase family protein [Acidimicrobiales bacterium]